MIKKLLARLNRRARPSSSHGLHILQAHQHQMPHNRISDAALEVIHTLNKHGFDAFLVGGGVRDLLLDLHPKDFDVATNATPEQVVRHFRRAMIIGRRFKIVHVRIGRDLIEVTTFRGHHHQNAHHKTAQRNRDGMLLRDNVYGSIEEDALRRDFTVNALYYDVNTRTIHDFAGGIADLHQRCIRIIGNAEQRYREDPVRMLRAVRLAAKLDFHIEEATANAIGVLRHQLREVPPARLFDEILKLFSAGYATPTFHRLNDFQLMAVLFPHTMAVVSNDDHFQRMLVQAMEDTDYRIHHDKRVSPAYLFAALLWPALRDYMAQLGRGPQTLPPTQMLHQAADHVLADLQPRITLPRRFSAPMKEIWQLQFRLAHRRGRRAQALAAHPRFRAAYDFLLLREAAGEDLDGLGQWWTDYQNLDDDARLDMADRVPASSPGGKRRSRRIGRRRSPS